MRTIRYRLSLDVVTPEGERTGSSVMQEQVRWHDGITHGLGSGPGVGMRYRAEATIVDLEHRGKLFCLIGHVQPLRLAFDFCEWIQRNPTALAEDTYLKFVDNLNLYKPKSVLRFADLPMLVRFRDVSNPQTIEQVYPGDLATSFGEGVELKNATMEITTNEPTVSIEDSLPWLDHLNTGSITGMTRWGPAKPEKVNYITSRNFRDRADRFS